MIKITAAAVLLAAGLSVSPAHAVDGILDSTFGIAGIVSTDIDAANYETGTAVAIQTDGKIVVAGYSTTVTSDDFALVRYNTDGSLDESFSGDGKVTTDIGTNSLDNGQSVAIQTDGKIVVAGYSDASGIIDFALVRYNTDGSLDTTGFGAGGKVTTDISSNSSDIGNAVAIQTDGKIVVAGYSNASGSNDFALVRYNTDGSLDTTGFGTGGKVTTDISSNSSDTGQSVAIQADRKIVVAGTSKPGTANDDFALVRYNTDGSLDTTGFGTGGKKVIDIGTNSADTVESAAIQADGKIVAAGYSNASGSYDFALVRYNADGSLDTAFGASGKKIIDIGTNSNDVGYSVAIQADGKIVVGGTSDASGGFTINRLNSDGSLDTTFDGDGFAGSNIDTGSTDSPEAVAIQADGKIVLIGSTVMGTGEFFISVRYNATTLAATLAPSTTTSTSTSIVFTVTGNGAVDCTTLSTTPGVDFNLTNISAITAITQTSPTVCTVSVASSAKADDVAVTSTLTAASSFSIGFTNDNSRTTLSGSPQSVTVTIPAVVTVTTPTTVVAPNTVVAPTTTAIKKKTVGKSELPKTGSNSSSLIAFAIVLLFVGLVATTRKQINN